MKTRLHRSEVRRQLGRLARCGGPNVPLRAIESALGYPLSEAGMDDLRGIIAALSAVVDAVYDGDPGKAVERDRSAEATEDAHPVPPLRMDATYCGLDVADIDNDGEGSVFALGHVNRGLALAVFEEHAHAAWGEALHDLPSEAALDHVEHRWVVNTGSNVDWRLEPAKEGDAAAFPVTWWLP